MSTNRDDDFDRLFAEVGEMDDDALDAVVGSAAADYNAPPARPPVDAMWAHIAAARRPAARGGIRVHRWQLLAASVAFVAFGITIGRHWTDVAAPTRASTPAAAGAHAGTAATRTTHATPATTAAPPMVATTSGSPAEPTEAPAGTTRAPSARNRSHAAPRVESSTPSLAASNRGSNAARTDAAYRVATMRHFVAVEALLASYDGSYDGSAHDAKTDAQLASWASDLLSQTRLLLDSPAGRDPLRRRLLQDLELVLVQMAQLGPNAPKLEHDLIDGSVRHNDIITRLRSAVPAGATTAL